VLSIDYCVCSYVAEPKPKKTPKRDKLKKANAKKETKTSTTTSGIWGEPTWGDAKWGAPADKAAAKKEPPPIPLFCRYLLSDEALWRPLFAMITGAVSWPGMTVFLWMTCRLLLFAWRINSFVFGCSVDSLSMARAVKCSLLFLPHTLSMSLSLFPLLHIILFALFPHLPLLCIIDITRFQQVWGEVLSACIRTLAGSRPELLDGIHLDIISLVKEIYNVLGRVSDVPRKVFATIPNMDLAELKVFSATILFFFNCSCMPPFPSSND
jgi:hypothetical protein